MLQVWAQEQVRLRADYLEYSNILANLNQIPKDRLGVELPTAYKESRLILELSKNHAIFRWPGNQ